MNAFEWTEVTSVEQALAQLRSDGRQTVVLKAGGVDLLDLMKERIVQPRRVVNLRRIEGLDRIEPQDDGSIRIGPLVTLSQLASDKTISEKFSALSQAAGRAATPQIRNMASVGGNLLQRPRCWYFRSEEFHCKKKGGARCFAQDGENQYHAIFDNRTCAIVHPSAAAVPLVAFGAKIELTGAKEKREILLEDFFTLPEMDVRRESSLRADELLTRIMIPAPPAGTTSAYFKQGEKQSFDWPIADVAVVLERDGDTCKRASIVLGAAAPVPHRAKSAEALLAGKKIDEALARQAGHAAIEGASPLAQNGYKLPLFKVIVRRAILGAAGIA